MAQENGTQLRGRHFVNQILTDKERIATLEGEVERLGSTLDQALGEMRCIRQKLEDANAVRRSGDIAKTEDPKTIKKR
jgi:hypothetical protein